MAKNSDEDDEGFRTNELRLYQDMDVSKLLYAIDKLKEAYNDINLKLKIHSHFLIL